MPPPGIKMPQITEADWRFYDVGTFVVANRIRRYTKFTDKERIVTALLLKLSLAPFGDTQTREICDGVIVRRTLFESDWRYRWRIRDLEALRRILP